MALLRELSPHILVSCAASTTVPHPVISFIKLQLPQIHLSSEEINMPSTPSISILTLHFLQKKSSTNITIC